MTPTPNDRWLGFTRYTVIAFFRSHRALTIAHSSGATRGHLRRLDRFIVDSGQQAVAP